MYIDTRRYLDWLQCYFYFFRPVGTSGSFCSVLESRSENKNIALGDDTKINEILGSFVFYWPDFFDKLLDQEFMAINLQLVTPNFAHPNLFHHNHSSQTA